MRVLKFLSRSSRALCAVALLIGMGVATPASAVLPLGGPVLIGGDDADDHGSTDTVTNFNGWFYIQRGFDLIGPNVTNGQPKVAVCLGCNPPSQTSGSALGAFESGFDLSTLPGLGWTRTTLTLPTDIADFFSGAGAVNVNNVGLIYMPTDGFNVTGGITDPQLLVVNTNASVLNSFVSNGGGLFTHDESISSIGFGWLTTLLPGIVHTDPFSGSCNDTTLNVTPAGSASLPGLTDSTASNATPWHSFFTGNFGGLDVLVTGPCGSGNQAVVLGGAQVVVSQAINLTPKKALNPVGPSNFHTVTATVIDSGGQPVVGTNVTFTITAGPNSPATATFPTDANGQASATYNDVGGAGVDTIQACFTDAQQQEHCDSVLKFWDNDCNTNGVPDTCDLSCNGFGGQCAVWVNPACGGSLDANTDQIPDECVTGCTPTDCNDDNPCTDDLCVVSTCSHTPNSGSCDDNDVCTQTSQCDGTTGACVGSNPVVCAPPDDCHNPGTCVSAQDQGCVYPNKPDGTPCTDGDSCTIDDACLAGQCTGDQRNCADNDPCTIDSCDNAGGDFLCVRADCNDTQSCPPEFPQCIAVGCGNNRLDTDETCDPPNPAPNPDLPSDPTCRANCTFCGDGVVQAGETCDDGNQVSGCDPRHPLKPLDACQNDCKPPICHDPSRLLFGDDFDTFEVHGRIVPVGSDTLDPTGKDFVIELTTVLDRVIFRASAQAGSLVGVPTGRRFTYNNPEARQTGGIAKVKITKNHGAYRVTAKAYGHIQDAQPDMVTHIFIGMQEWTVAGSWDRLNSGWRFTGR